ncbi:MAG TPA: glutamine-hydrolyzing carbamoyl-phosphate synthase small subunit [Saprospiraceae bacterium]|nr:glutamine-hydrolyzing carbamoyl-phosphate synthase small subunit [Saprospiraceae bacterium]
MRSDSGAPSAILLLEDGMYFEGKAAGKPGTATGELCFNTGMTGYQEIFTDPSYYGQILVTTHVHIGNYGIKSGEVESNHMQINALVCKTFIDEYSRALADQSIQSFFENEGKLCIYGVDTRSIVRHIRSKGAMNAIVSNEITDLDILKQKLKAVPSMEGLELASIVSTKTSYEVGDPNSKYRISALDYGIKANILKCLVDRGCHVKVFPAKSSFEELMAFAPHGIFLSNGPGDPATMNYAIKTITKLVDSNIPLFGICLGHQLLALSQGIPTYKMHHGHRGINHPVLNVVSGLCEITTQNHGFGVSPGEIAKYKDKVDVTHVNLNDQTIEGLSVKGKPAFSVQYHPESSPGPHDSRYLFDQYIAMIQSLN